MTIPQSRIEAIQNALGIKHGFDKNICDGWTIGEILEAAAAYDRAHPPKVTDVMIDGARRSLKHDGVAFLTAQVVRRAIEAAMWEMLGG